MAEEPVVVANRYPYLPFRRQAVPALLSFTLSRGPRYRCTPDPSFRLVDLARTPLRRLRHYKGKPGRNRPGVDSCGPSLPSRHEVSAVWIPAFAGMTGDDIPGAWRCLDVSLAVGSHVLSEEVDDGIRTKVRPSAGAFHRLCAGVVPVDHAHGSRRSGGLLASGRLLFRRTGATTLRTSRPRGGAPHSQLGGATRQADAFRRGTLHLHQPRPRA